MRPVPVLMYHHINHHKGDMVTVTPEVFEEQMEYLCRNNYRTLKIHELISYIKGELELNQKAVVITFDDGWLDNYIYAFPVLKKYKINATIFIITDRTERTSLENSKFKIQNSKPLIPTHKESKILIENGEDWKVVLNWETIKEMKDSGLIEFYSHTKTHAKCDFLTESELKEELAGSNKIIKERLKSLCLYLCWPYGRYNELAVNIAKDIGYKAIFTTEHGVVKTGSNPFAVKRIVVKDSIPWFKRRMVVYTNQMFSGVYLKIKDM